MNSWISVLVSVCVFQQIIFLNNYFELYDFSILGSYVSNFQERLPKKHLYISQTLENIKPELENIYQQFNDLDLSLNNVQNKTNIYIEEVFSFVDVDFKWFATYSLLFSLFAWFYLKGTSDFLKFVPVLRSETTTSVQIDNDDIVIHEEKITQIPCPVCTFLNNDNTVSCSMCETLLVQ